MASRRGRGPVDGEVRNRIAAHLRKTKSQLDCSIRELARRIGCSHAYLARIVGGQTTPGLELLLRCKRELGISADCWLEQDPEAHWYKEEYGPRRRQHGISSVKS